MPSSHLILCRPLLLLPPIPPSIRVFSNESTLLMEFQLQHHSFQRNPRADLLQNGLVGCPCSPRDSQESSPTTQFKSINSLSLSLLHSLTLPPWKVMRNRRSCLLSAKGWQGIAICIHQWEQRFTIKKLSVSLTQGDLEIYCEGNKNSRCKHRDQAQRNKECHLFTDGIKASQPKATRNTLVVS